MSSLRNSIQRRSHRERAQPHERKRLGILEKHKDYALRAKDYKEKKQYLRTLTRKAAERNDDEFYFGMMSRQGAGTAISRGKKAFSGTVGASRGQRGQAEGIAELDVDAVRLLKTQDVGYVRTMRNVAMKELLRIEEQVRAADAGATTGGHIVFVDDEEESDKTTKQSADAASQTTAAPGARKPKSLGWDDLGIATFDEDEDEEDEEDGQDEADDDNDDDMDTDRKGIDDWGFEDSDDDEDDEPTKPLDRKAAAKAAQRAKLHRKLEQAKHKVKVLTDAEQQLAEQRAKMAKTATSGGKTRKGQRIMVRTRKR